MPSVKPYNRVKAVEYANKWAFKRNPAYYDFSLLGGDCTNFISQCLYAGSGVMNYTPTTGWYYISAYDRAPAWTGVQFLYKFLVTNTSKAVFGTETSVLQIMIGDVIQLGNYDGNYYHTLIVSEVGDVPDVDNIRVTTHTYDALLRPLSTYDYAEIRFIHIKGVYI